MHITIRNDFHHTSCGIRLRSDQYDVGGDVRLTRSQVARCKRILCGIAGCTCGGNLGERPALDAVPDYQTGGATLHDYLHAEAAQ